MTVDKKASFMVEEFRKFNMNIIGINETKWFGQEKYEVDGFVILHSGRPVPVGDEAVERNEGVGIVLDSGMAKVWKDSGEVWKPVSSRAVHARLELPATSTGRQVALSIVSVYAPTHGASQEIKDKFYEKVRDEFVEKVVVLVEEGLVDNCDGAGTWEVVKKSMVEAAVGTLGWETRRQRDWFKEKGLLLRNIIEERNGLFRRWLRSSRNEDRQRYVAKRREINREMRKAKNDWMQEKAREIEVGFMMGNSHRGMRKTLKELQRSKAGLRPMKTRMIRKANDDPCNGGEEVINRWQEHFSQVLRTIS